jgi:hypothetical protein
MRHDNDSAPKVAGQALIIHRPKRPLGTHARAVHTRLKSENRLRAKLAVPACTRFRGQSLVRLNVEIGQVCSIRPSEFVKSKREGHQDRTVYIT